MGEIVEFTVTCMPRGAPVRHLRCNTWIVRLPLLHNPPKTPFTVCTPMCKCHRVCEGRHYSTPTLTYSTHRHTFQTQILHNIKSEQCRGAGLINLSVVILVQPLQQIPHHPLDSYWPKEADQEPAIFSFIARLIWALGMAMSVLHSVGPGS